MDNLTINDVALVILTIYCVVNYVVFPLVMRKLHQITNIHSLDWNGLSATFLLWVLSPIVNVGFLVYILNKTNFISPALLSWIFLKKD